MSVSFGKIKIRNNSSANPIADDVVIIGGGIVGLSTAYWLQKRRSKLKKFLYLKKSSRGWSDRKKCGFITCGSVEHFNRLVGKHGKEEATQIWKFSEENLSLLKNEIIDGRGTKPIF